MEYQFSKAASWLGKFAPKTQTLSFRSFILGTAQVLQTIILLLLHLCRSFFYSFTPFSRCSLPPENKRYLPAEKSSRTACSNDLEMSSSVSQPRDIYQKGQFDCWLIYIYAASEFIEIDSVSHKTHTCCILLCN